MVRVNRIRDLDWVKFCVDPNGRIKLRAKQKYEILSATYILYMICKRSLLMTFLNEPELICLNTVKWLYIFLIYIYIYIYGGARGVMVLVVGNGYGNMSSYPGRG